MAKKVISLVNGVFTEVLLDEASGSLSACDISLLMASMFENYLVDPMSEILTDALGVPIGFELGIFPASCSSHYDDSLTNSEGNGLFGLEGELLI